MPPTDRGIPDLELSAHGELEIARQSASLLADLDVVLTPLARPELSDIPINGELEIGRTDQPFASYPHDIVKLLSRRHARIFCKDGRVYVIDLQSSNGTTVNRVDVGQIPLPLRDGDEICLGGELSYLVRITARARIDGSENHSKQRGSLVPPADNKTRYVDAPGSFLQALCDPPQAKLDAPPGTSVALAGGAKDVAVRPLGRVMSLMREFVAPNANSKPRVRRWWKAAAAAGSLGAIALTTYIWMSPERALHAASARGDYARAAMLADRLLQKHPDDVELKAQATDMVLKANVPRWLAMIRARDFDGAKGVLAGMSAFRAHDDELRPLIGELEWVGELERLESDRGGPEAPLRMYADEDSIGRLIAQWNDDNSEHQRALVRIAAYVPQFGDWYGEVLTYLRRLQSESAVYLPVIERLKGVISTELERDEPEALQALLAQTAAKYPDLGGLDKSRQELARYIDIRQEARTRQSGRLFALMRGAHFVTPPFEQNLRRLMETGELPSSDLLQQYDIATRDWMDGDSNGAFAELQKMTAGPWGNEASAELGRRREVASRFAAIQQSLATSTQVDQLLTFEQSLDPEEDVYFVRATADELKQEKDSVIAQAQEAMNRARSLWDEYRRSGAIDATLRAEGSISEQFRSRARLLAEAHSLAQRGFLIYSQIDTAAATQWSAIRSEIDSEQRQQRKSLYDLSNVLEPDLLKSKVTLLGDSNE
jgi:hypothetical protein